MINLDIKEMKNYQIYNEDCFKIMDQMIKNGDKVDCIITDPPYELNISGGGGFLKERKIIKEKHIDFISNGFDYEKCFSNMLKLCEIPNFLIFCSNNQVSKTMIFFEKLNIPTTLLVWNKTNPIPMSYNKYVSDLEFIVYIHGKGATFNNNVDYNLKLKVKKYSSPSKKDRVHPTQKPVSLLNDFIRLHTKENDIIFDPFMGSGSTGVASLNNNRRFIGCEIDKIFFDKAKNILENLSIQQKLF